MASSSRSPDQVALMRAGLLVLAVATVGRALGLWDLHHLMGRLPDLCLFHVLTGHDCPGCGMGRALALLARGEILASLRQHPFGLPLAVWASCWALLPERWLAPIQRSWAVRSDALAITAIGLIVLWWVGLCPRTPG